MCEGEVGVGKGVGVDEFEGFEDGSGGHFCILLVVGCGGI